MTSQEAIAALVELRDEEKARHALRYFKCGPGEYGEGDRFLGIRVPDVRKLVRVFAALPLAEVTTLLHSEYHEARLLALLLLVRQYEKGDNAVRKRIYELYLANTAYINNWDLVDSSAGQIVGEYLYRDERNILFDLAGSDSLWERRIAMMATFFFIRQGEFADALAIAERLLHDTHDLIHKAVGWMLREIGNRDREVEEGFLKQHYKKMPRTMLRYAIEKFPEDLRQAYLKGNI